MSIPQQERAVDPFSSYSSSNVSRITRVLTAGEDKIARDSDVLPSLAPASSTIIRITDGVAIKDDILLHFKDVTGGLGYQEFDATDPFNYSQQVLMSGPFATYGYLVIAYQYVKTPQVPEAQFLILNNPALEYDPELYIFLGRVNFSTPTTVDSIQLFDGSIVRPVANLTDGYTDQDAIDAQVIGNNNIQKTWTGTPVTQFHGLGVYPIVQIMDNDGGMDQGQLVQAIIVHTNTDEFTVDFDTDNQTTPYDFIIIY